jgi:hypothetical protein
MRVIEDAADHESPTHRLACLQFVADRLDGKARQSIEVSGDQPREIALADLVRMVLAARSVDAVDATPTTIEQPSQAAIPHSRDPA